MRNAEEFQNQVLVVDDDNTSLLILESILKKSGYIFKTASSGEQVVELLQSFHADLILLDLIMPGMDGYQTLEQIRMLSGFEDTPVIFLTGSSDMNSMVKAFEAGAVDYVTKPYEAMEVLARIKVHMKLAVAMRQLVELQAELSRQISEGQESLLVKASEVEGANFNVEYIPLHQAGGDMYEVIKLNKDQYAFFVADIAGHAIKTSYLTASIKTLLHQNCSAGNSALESIRVINKILCKTLKPGQYMTATLCLLDYRSQVLETVSMAHPPVLFIPRNAPARLIEMEGDVLGAFENGSWQSRKIRIHPGDRFILYTDGLLETKGDVWSSNLNRLVEAGNIVADIGMSKVASKLKEVLINQDKVDDDLVILVAEMEDREVEKAYSSLNAEFASDRDNISVAVKMVMTFLRGKILNIEEFELKLILHEVFGNAVIHGNKDQVDKIFQLQCFSTQNSFELTVRDQGTGFNWKKKLENQKDVELNETHGRGFLLLKAYGFGFEFNEIGNQITISKTYRPFLGDFSI